MTLSWAFLRGKTMTYNFFDRAIEVISPAWAARRETARTELLALRSFNGAKISKTRPNWRRVEEDADTAILSDLPALRARCNDLVENNDLVAGVVEDFCKNVVGAGIKPQYSAADGENAAAENAERSLRTRLENPALVDVNEIDDYYDLEMLALRHWLIDGEFFARIANSGRIEIIDPGRIWSDRFSGAGSNEIRSGIEIDARGRHVAYYVGPHPGAYNGVDYRFTRIPAADMIHGYVRKKAGQTRGYPIFAPVIEKLHDLDEMGRAALVSARIAACVGLIIQRQRHGAPAQNDDGDNIDHIYPGMIKRLRPGEVVSTLDPKQPGQQFQPFCAHNQRAVAAGLGISYETLSRDMSQGNFSSSRLAKINENATFKLWQNWLIKKFCRPTFAAIQDYLFLRGEQREIYDVRWQTPGFAWVDPEKDVAAAILAVRNNLKDKQAVIAESGGDIEEIYARRAREIARESELGINADAQPDKSTVSDAGKISAANV